ncbi:rCG31059, isoform CRA_c [Rattus norvegicus]|uniref:RCG31059, isoform CRA_c n=1 Tax=Rattus norvegicus TaxID=10116 RepID=A6IUW1_RAT|nr:rCG31059, isoform CRA_c [Rattus norvegicus]
MALQCLMLLTGLVVGGMSKSTESKKILWQTYLLLYLTYSLCRICTMSAYVLPCFLPF